MLLEDALENQTGSKVRVVLCMLLYTGNQTGSKLRVVLWIPFARSETLADCCLKLPGSCWRRSACAWLPSSLPEKVYALSSGLSFEKQISKKTIFNKKRTTMVRLPGYCWYGFRAVIWKRSESSCRCVIRGNKTLLDETTFVLSMTKKYCHRLSELPMPR